MENIIHDEKKLSINIAHRISTVKYCDVIYVMNEGKIVESGKFDELMKKKAFFYTLVEGNN